METNYGLKDYFSDVETTKEHNGYWCSIGEVLTIVILGSFCGLRNPSQIHQWASNARVSEFLAKHFEIEKVPCYYWMLCLLKIIKPKSLNQCFMKWTQSFLPDGMKGFTLSFDGKTIRSTGKMARYDKPLHIVSAHVAELGITIGQKAVDEKSNEIPAVRDLIELLNIEGCMVVADALHCQKETAKAVIDAGADYLLSVKDNQETLKKDIEDYVQDGDLRKTMDTSSTLEQNSGRIERRIAFTTGDIDWLYGKEDWEGIACIGAVNTKFSTPKGQTDEWYYYISSRALNAHELLKHARLEWSVEVMHWHLDVHFGEDFCRVEDENVQQNLNIARKIVLNSLHYYKDKTGSKRPLSKIMFGCLLDCDCLIPILEWAGFEN
jgi:predicted transposase YbfD/YdcC